jgi:hypothetical protein
MHSTDDLNDGYIGSGQRLSRSIKKHGRENHTCEIVEFLLDRGALILRETEIVSQQLLSDPLCLNMALGGVGGFTGGLEAYNATVSKEQRSKLAKDNPPTWSDRRKEEQRKRIEILNAARPVGVSMWVYSESEQCSKKINIAELETYIANGWHLGRKMKF